MQRVYPTNCEQFKPLRSIDEPALYGLTPEELNFVHENGHPLLYTWGGAWSAVTQRRQPTNYQSHMQQGNNFNVIAHAYTDLLFRDLLDKILNFGKVVISDITKHANRISPYGIDRINHMLEKDPQFKNAVQRLFGAFVREKNGNIGGLLLKFANYPLDIDENSVAFATLVQVCRSIYCLSQPDTIDQAKEHWPAFATCLIENRVVDGWQ